MTCQGFIRLTLCPSLCCNAALLWLRGAEVTCRPQCCIVCLHWSLVTVSVCTIFKVCWLKKTKTKHKKVDSRTMCLFLRICSKVRCQMLDVCVSSSSGCLPPNQEGADCVIQLCCRIISQLRFLRNSGWPRTQTAWAGSNQLITCQINRSHHVTKVQRRRIKPLYEVFKKKEYFCIKQKKKTIYRWKRRKESLYSEQYKWPHSCTDCSNASACSSSWPSVNSDQWLYEGHTHNSTAAISQLAPPPPPTHPLLVTV